MAVVFFLGAVTAAASSRVPQNYVFFNLDRAGIHTTAFSGSGEFSGAQIKYTWRSLEPSRGVYDFSAIAEDLAFLDSTGKGLFLQVQDVSFVPTIKNVPDYILTDPAYHGGAGPQYSFADDKDTRAAVEGWVARRWDPAVAGRFHLLLAELGKQFDGKVRGVTLPETSVDFGQTGRYFPEGFSPATYGDAIKADMSAAKAAFKRSTVIQYANFMPGEWLPWDDKGYLSTIYAFAAAIGVGAGGPDVIPFRRGQMNHAYHFASLYKGRIPLGFAVQEGNYEQKNDATGKRMTVADIYDFAAKDLGAEFIFWFPQEPWFTRDVVPFLARLK